jgi:hypothetical protein
MPLEVGGALRFRLEAEDREQKSEIRRQRTEGRRQREDFRLYIADFSSGVGVKSSMVQPDPTCGRWLSSGEVWIKV